MEINSNKWSLSLDLDGGRIKYLAFDNFPILGTYKRVDGKLGNTHICAPSFDKEGEDKFNLPFHGYARTLQWDFEKIADNVVQIKTITTSTKTYPAKLELIQRFVLGETFKHSVEVKHIDGLEVPVNIGIHYYWDTPKGWNDVQINNTNIKTNIETNGNMKLLPENIIKFPHATYKLSTKEFHSAALWTSFKLNEMGIKKYSTDFCCIEPIIGWPGYFGTPKSFIKPHETVSVFVELQKVV